MPAAMLILAHRTLGHFGVVITGAGVFAAVDFNHTITLGSVLLGFVVMIVAGVFTVRSRIASIWRQEAEGERAAKDRLAEELSDERVDRISFEKEQQQLRHDLKDELVGVHAQLKIMEAKTDLTAALEKIQEINANTTDAIVAAMHSTARLSEDRDGATHKLLTEIRDKLPDEPIDVRDVTTE